MPLRWVLVRDPRHAFKPVALLTTDLAADPEQTVTWFNWRWQVEVTFAEARRHLGVETQRQWSDLAIRRTTPTLLGLFSLVTLVAHQKATAPARQTSWYQKRQPTFSDALALVRRHLWSARAFSTSDSTDDMMQVPRAVVEVLTDTLCYAA